MDTIRTNPNSSKQHRQDESEVEKEASSTPEAQEKKDESQIQISASHHIQRQSVHLPQFPVHARPIKPPNMKARSLKEGYGIPDSTLIPKGRVASKAPQQH
ncbi:hypothetical protein BST61_g5923 [Cercospora zeina]